MYDLFCTLQPGVPLLALHGKIKQEGRTKVYFDFLQRPYAVLFATDVAARGLDFHRHTPILHSTMLCLSSIIDRNINIEYYIKRRGIRYAT